MKNILVMAVGAITLGQAYVATSANNQTPYLYDLKTSFVNQQTCVLTGTYTDFSKYQNVRVAYVTSSDFCTDASVKRTLDTLDHMNIQVQLSMKTGDVGMTTTLFERVKEATKASVVVARRSAELKVSLNKALTGYLSGAR